MADENAYIFNQNEAAQILGCSAVWMRDHAAPRRENGGYDLRQVVPWFVARLESSTESAAQAREDAALLRERIRKIEISKTDLQKGSIGTAAFRDIAERTRKHVERCVNDIAEEPELYGPDTVRRINAACVAYEKEVRNG